jgi:hypothetical protein
MGKKAARWRRQTERALREPRLTLAEQRRLLDEAVYEGSPLHKRSPGDFGLTPPAAPRPDKTLCDEARVATRAEADALLRGAILGGLVSEGLGGPGFPKQLWVVRDDGQVFELMYGGSRLGAYHGYPIRRADPLFDEITERWEAGRG